MNFRKQLQYGYRYVLREWPLVAARSADLRRREQETPEVFRALQEKLMSRTLNRAAEVLPAYCWLRGRVPLSGVMDFLRDQVSVIGKAELMDDKGLHAPNGGRPKLTWFVGKTSGTTGTPLQVFRSYDSTLWEGAFHRQHWQWAGIADGARQVVLRGDVVTPIQQETPPFWIEDRIGRQLIVSTRHLNDRNVGAIAEAIQRYGARHLRAYPSAARLLAELSERHGIGVSFQSIITGSETLYPADRELIQRTFSAQVFDFYGMAERVAFAAECSHGRMHVHPEYSFVELVDDDGRPAQKEGYVVGTTFRNLAQPLLRYRLSDRARWSAEACPCGCTYPVFELVAGKVEDRMFDADGNVVSGSIITFAFKGISNILRSQVAQVSASDWVVRVVPGPGFDAADEEALLRNFRNLVSARTRVRVQQVEAIAALPSGKFKWVSQEHHVAPRSGPAHARSVC